MAKYLLVQLNQVILKLQKSKAFKGEEIVLVKALCEEYDDHLQNLKVLKEELEEELLDPELEAPILMETSEAVLNNALTFILSIPKTLSKTEIGKDIPFEDFSDMIYSVNL